MQEVTEECPVVMSEEDITKALEAVRMHASRAEQERSDLDRVIAAAHEEQRLLERLLALRRGRAPESDGKLAEQKQYDIHPGASAEVRHPVVREVIRQLATAGRPVHISELMRVLRDSNVPIPGSGTQANLITHLRRDERVVRPSRGMYGLAEWGLTNMQAARRRRRRRKPIRRPKEELADGP